MRTWALVAAFLLAGCAGAPTPAESAESTDDGTQASDGGRLSQPGQGAYDDEPLFTGPGEPVTSEFEYTQMPDAAAGGVVFMIPCQRFDVERPADVGEVLVEYVWVRYAEPTGVEHAQVTISSGNNGNETTQADARGVMALTLPAAEWESDLWICVYPAQDATVMGPAPTKVYVTAFRGGLMPDGFTAVSA